MAINTKDKHRINFIMTGSEITTAQKVSMARVFVSQFTNIGSAIRAALWSGTDFNLTNKDLNAYFKIDVGSFCQQIAQTKTLPYTAWYELRYDSNQAWGYRFEFGVSRLNENQLNFSFRVYTIRNGTYGGNVSLAAGRGIYIPPTSAQEEVALRISGISKGGNLIYLPCIISTPNATNSYIAMAVDWLDSVAAYRNPGLLVSTGDTWNRVPNTHVEASEGDLFPRPGEETEGNGEITDDNMSVDIDFPEDSLTDDLDEILRDGDFVTTYKVNKTQLQQVGIKLWDTNIFSELKKIFNNPMDSIVSVQAFPFNVASSGTTAFKLGGLDMGFNAGKIDKNHQEVDCGELNVGEYWGTFLDYTSTRVSIFLPFVGIQQLPIQEIMDATLHVKYKVDIVSGSFICWLRYNKEGKTQVLARYSGSCASQIPVSSQSHSGILSALTAIPGITMAAATGNYVDAFAGGAAAAINALKTDHSQRGNYSMNTGFMDTRVPYLIIERARAQSPSTYAEENGIPSFITAKLSTCKGFTKVDDIELNFSALEEEKAEIKQLLMSGIII